LTRVSYDNHISLKQASLNENQSRVHGAYEHQSVSASAALNALLLSSSLFIFSKTDASKLLTAGAVLGTPFWIGKLLNLKEGKLLGACTPAAANPG
jgi:hypothetical protein